MHDKDSYDWETLAATIKAWGRELGFGAIGISDTDLGTAEAGLEEWLANGYHGEMDYMASHGTKRARPAELHPGTIRVITARMDYTANDLGTEWIDGAWKTMEQGKAYIARYALGRDYHKVLRSRLQQLSDRIANEIGAFGYRVSTDSAPVLEVTVP